MSGTKLVVIWGYDCATTMQYFMYKDPPRAKNIQKSFMGLLFWITK